MQQQAQPGAGPSNYYPPSPQGWGQQRQTGPYWSQSGYTGYYSLPSRQVVRPGQERKASRKALYAVAFLILVLGVFLIYKGVTATPPKLSTELSAKIVAMSPGDSVIIGAVCLPNLCGATQEASLVAVVGKDNYKGTVKNQVGQEVMIAKATASQVQALTEKDWITYIAVVPQ